uniref:SSHCSHL338 n=1 Tax=Channa striata TaxID=64152 RepID=A0A077H0T0_CHASR|nr:SSHCSHL338 [Channa striata]
MKTVILAVLVLSVFSQSEGLKCLCGGNRQCSGPTETCSASIDACFNLLIYVGSRPPHSKGCMSSWDCSRLNQPGISSCRSCKFDLCNK